MDGQFNNQVLKRTRWSTGVIVDYSVSTQTYTVMTSLYPNAVNGVPRVVRDSGEVSVLAPNTEVVVHTELGILVIDGVLKRRPLVSIDQVAVPASLSDGLGEADVPLNEDISYRSDGDPRDLYHGDWLRKSPDGNHVSVLAGGVNGLVSSPLAAVYTLTTPVDTVQINSHAFRHTTAMSESSITTDGDGRSNFRWYGAGDVRAQSQKEGWTIRLDAGAEGDLVDLRVTSPDGANLAQIHISASGKITLMGVDGVDITSSSTATSVERSAGTRDIQVGRDYRLAAEGSVGFAGSDMTLSALGAYRSSASGTRAETTGGDHKSLVMGNYKQTVQGGTLPTTNVTARRDVLNGGNELVIGSALKPLPGQVTNTVSYSAGGAINFVIQPVAAGAKFNVVTTEPDSVCLGANGAAVENPAIGGHTVTAVAPFGVMKFEPWAAMMETLITWLDSHAHLTAVGPTGPALAGPIGPIRPMLTPLLQPIRSVRVCVGL